IPSSATRTSTRSWFRRAPTGTVPPPGEYLSAFSTRVLKTWRTLSGSASAASGSAGRAVSQRGAVLAPPSSPVPAPPRPAGLLATAGDRDQALARRGLRLGGLQLPLQNLQRRQTDGLLLRHARDLFGGGVPEDDLAVPVDRDDAVCDVGKDRNAAFLLEGDARIELGVREGGGRVPRKR